MQADDAREDGQDLRDGRRSVLDRELDELTSELRTVIPGVTVLLAFLLTLPFTAAFPDLTDAQRSAYFIAFMCTALAVVFLLGEGAYHRVRGKPYDKRALVRTATRQAVTALALLAVALTAVIFLVTDVLYRSALSALLAAAVAVLTLVTWFGLPLSRRIRRDG